MDPIRDTRTTSPSAFEAKIGRRKLLKIITAAAASIGLSSSAAVRMVEAATQGLNYLFNEVRPTHPDRDGVTRFLTSRGFVPDHEGRLLRRRVRV